MQYAYCLRFFRPSQLLNLMQHLSANFIDKTKSLQNELEDLGSEATTAELKLNNTFSQLLMLSSNQFIENVSLHVLIS